MKKLLVLFCTVFLILCFSGGAGAAPVFVAGVTASSGWTDADGTGDALMCWAAAAANALYFTGWDGGFDNADQILDYYKGHWSDGTGNAYYAAQWFFDGDETHVGSAGTTANLADGGNFYSTADFSANNGSWNPPLLANLQTWVTRTNTPGDGMYDGTYGIMALVEDSLGFDHYINIWGYDNDGSGDIYITDNNTGYGLERVSFAGLNATLLERINENGWDNDWVAPNDLEPDPDPDPDVPPVPEPSTFLLFAAGLLGLSRLSRKKFFR